MNEIVISGIKIEQDEAGRYSLNSLHKAAGWLPKNQPAFSLRSAQTQALIEEMGVSADLQPPPQDGQ